MPAVRVRSYRRAGRLVPPPALAGHRPGGRRDRGLRASAVVLTPGEAMDWHSTEGREELLILLSGRVQLEVETRHRSRLTLRAGQCAYVPGRTRHRVLNRSSVRATYVYVTAPTT